jgi:hypothetical protein
MVEPCKNSECLGHFTVAAVGGGAPGGKDIEIIECPHCGAEQTREMTSVAYIVTPVYDERHPKPA